MSERPFSKKYVLRDKTPVEVDDIDAWAKEFEKIRIIKRTLTKHHLISTIFLGVDHGWTAYGPPILFETMSFERAEVKSGEQEQERYATYDEAIAGHDAMVARHQQLEAADATEKGNGS